jgi:hypothetical protein
MNNLCLFSLPLLLFVSRQQVTLALSPKEVKIIKCNGNNLNRNKKKHDVYALHPDYLSQSIVVIGVFHPP